MAHRAAPTLAKTLAKTLALLMAASTAQADYDPSQYPPYETCALCHGLFGVSHTAKFPNLGGQKPAYIEAQIKAFHSGNRNNDGGQMATIVTELHPDAVPIVVEWFATQDPPEPYPADDTTLGEFAFMDLGCVGCHDNDAEGAPEVPYLTAQHPGYLVKQMTDFKDGTREVTRLPALHKKMLALPDDKIAEIAAYLAAQPRPK